MATIQYEVQPRSASTGTVYAVNRRGVRGGVKTITVYSNEHVAAAMARDLTARIPYEITGP